MRIATVLMLLICQIVFQLMLFNKQSKVHIVKWIQVETTALLFVIHQSGVATAIHCPATSMLGHLVMYHIQFTIRVQLLSQNSSTSSRGTVSSCLIE